MTIWHSNSVQSKTLQYEQRADASAQHDKQERITWYKRWSGNRKDRSAQPSYLPLVFCLLTAIVVRAFIVIHTQGFIDGDEALVGIQAEHILRGQFPIYFYNQSYMGSLEAYIMAGIFAIAGPSVWALRAEPILLSLVVVWLTWKLASMLADTAQLPPNAKRWFMIISAFLATFPPLYDTVLELRTLGGYIEIFIFMLLLMIFALSLTNRRVAGAPGSELAWRWAGIGFIIGLGLWVNPLIFYAILAVAIWILLDWIKALTTASTSPHTSVRQTFLKTLLLPALASIPACTVGLMPAIYWGALNQWQNITNILQLSESLPLSSGVQAQYPTRLDLVFGLARLYTTCVGPRILSGALPGENAALTLLHTPTFIINGLCILATVALVAASFVKPHPLLITTRRLAALPIVFASSVSIIFCLTETAASGLASCQFDFAGRYATPLMLVMPFFVATIFTVVIVLNADPQRMNHTQTMDAEQISAGEENVIDIKSGSFSDTPATPHITTSTASMSPYWNIALALLVGFLILSVYLQAALYAASDAGSTFQSTFCTRVPANNNAIIAYLERQHIHYAWANNWIAYPIVFKTHESIIISDPIPLIRNTPFLDRIPAYTEAVLKAVRPSFLVTVKHNNPYPLILKYLDIHKIKYNLARFPSREGRDLLVVTPLTQTVPPLDNSFYSMFACSRTATG